MKEEGLKYLLLISVKLTCVPGQVRWNFKCDCIQKKPAPGKTIARSNSRHLVSISCDRGIIGQRFVMIDDTPILWNSSMHCIQELVGQPTVWSDKQKVVHPS